MKNTSMIGLLVLAALVGAQDPPRATLTDGQFVDQWLAQDCFDGDSGCDSHDEGSPWISG